MLGLVQAAVGEEGGEGGGPRMPPSIYLTAEWEAELDSEGEGKRELISRARLGLIAFRSRKYNGCSEAVFLLRSGLEITVAMRFAVARASRGGTIDRI